MSKYQIYIVQFALTAIAGSMFFVDFVWDYDTLGAAGLLLWMLVTLWIVRST